MSISMTQYGHSYVVMDAQGHVYTYGPRMTDFSNPLNNCGPLVGIAATADGQGYIAVSNAGCTYASGNVVYRGNGGGTGITIVGIAVTSDGQGYIEVGSRGETYAFGDVQSRGNPQGFSGSIVGVSVTADGQGYAEVSSVGQVYNFGTSVSRGNPSGFAGSIVGISSTADGQGYVVVSSAGQVYNFGTSQSLGNPSGYAGTITGVSSMPNGTGYAVVSSGGDAILFGTADNTPPPIPDSSQSQPPIGSIRMSDAPPLSINSVTDVDGDPVYYWFRVATNADAETGQVLNSGWLGSPAWSPPSGSLQDGGTYYWKVFTWDGLAGPASSSPVSLRINLRLGSQPVSPTDSAGPVTVNMANGNASLDVTSPSFQTIGGPLGVNFAYNSRAPGNGLRGSYYDNCVTDGQWPPRAFPAQPTLERTDPAVNFQWGNGSPAPGLIGADNFCARWDGFISVPFAQEWCFALGHDDGAVLTINGSVVYSDWADGDVSPDLSYGGTYCTDLFSDRTNTISIEYYEHSGGAHIELWAVARVAPFTWIQVPPSWLSSTPPSLPTGWTMSVGASSALRYATAQITSSSLVLVSPDGATFSYAKTTTGAYQPEAGQQDVVTEADEAGIGHEYVVASTDGNTYTFNSRGQLVRVVGPTDPAHVAAPIYDYSGDSGRVQKVTDPVSVTSDPTTTRSMTFYYAALNGTDPNCVVPSSYSNPPRSDVPVEPPPGMLCRIDYWDGTQTLLFYDANGDLARIAQPGGETWDFLGYTGTLLTAFRTPLQNDAITAGIRPASDATAEYDIGYANGQATDVTSPAPTSGASRPHRSYAYANHSTILHVTGLSEPNGFVRKTDYDDAGHIVNDWPTFAASVANTTRSTWLTGDELASVIDPAGRETTHFYDYANRQTDTYGPAPASCFGSNNLPNGSCTNPPVAHTATQYDGGMHGLAATYWSNNALAGSPTSVAFATGDGTNFGYDWGSGAPVGLPSDNWSARFTGYLTFPTAGTYTLTGCADDYVRVVFDDIVQADRFGQPPGCGSGTVTVAAGSTHRIRIDYAEVTGTANLGFYWTPPGGSSQFVPVSALSPGYGLVTQTTTDDSTTGSPPSVTQTQYDHPELGLQNRVIQDPAGQALTTTTGYEPAGSGFYRRTSRQLPAGNTWTYTYYGNTQTVQDPCTGTTSPSQAGLLASETAPLAADASQRVTHFVYDVRGRTSATWAGNDTPTCYTYDARGRLVSKTVPAFGTQPAFTYAYNYDVGNNALVTSAATGAATVTTTVDLLGRVTDYVDAWGNHTTTTYDLAGRVTDTNGPAGAFHTDYDTDNRVADQQLNGATLAVAGYDANSELNGATYPNGSGNAGNGTALTLTKDGSGRVTDMNWTNPAGTLTTDHVAYSQSGRIIDETIDGTDANPTGPNFTYDSTGRLTNAHVGGHTLTYQFAGTGGCGADPNAGLNTNRTSLSDTNATGTTTTTYCYDNADRLTSTTASGATGITYDSHGNTATLGRQHLGYDGADRHLTTDYGTSVHVTYQRDATDRIIQRTETSPTTIAYIASATATTTGTALTITKPAGTKKTQTFIAQIAVASNATLTPPTGWTMLSQLNPTAGLTQYVYVKTATATEPTSYTFTIATAAAAVGAIVTYSNVAAATAGTSATATTGTKMTIPAMTTTLDANAVLDMYATAATTTHSKPSGTTNRYTTNAAGTPTISLFDGKAPIAGTITAKKSTSGATTAWAGRSILLTPSTTTTVTRYGYTANGDSPDLALSATNAVLERDYGLVGGAMLTKRASTALDRWSYLNIHGDIAATTDGNGAKIGGTAQYDPYGNLVAGVAPDNSNSNYDYAWLGQQQRGLEHAGANAGGAINTIEMGARQYSPSLGRFLQVDAVDGGSANDYDYAAADPMNRFDITGASWKFYGITYSAWQRHKADSNWECPWCTGDYKTRNVYALYVDGHGNKIVVSATQRMNRWCVGVHGICYKAWLTWQPPLAKRAQISEGGGSYRDYDLCSLGLKPSELHGISFGCYWG